VRSSHIRRLVSGDAEQKNEVDVQTLLSESEEAHPTLGRRYWTAAKQEQADRRWIMHHSLELGVSLEVGVHAAVADAIHSVAHSTATLRACPDSPPFTGRAKKARTDPLCETREWGHQLARWLAFLTIAINRVVSEVLAHLGVVTQRSKGNNYSSAGATILPRSGSGFASVAPVHRDIHDDDVRGPICSDRDGFPSAKSHPAFDALERPVPPPRRNCRRPPEPVARIPPRSKLSLIHGTGAILLTFEGLWSPG